MKAKASVLVAAVVACSCAPKVPEKPKARLFTCHRALDKITLDGHITETAWDRAQKITEFTIPGTNRPAAQPATDGPRQPDLGGRRLRGFPQAQRR